MKTVLASNLKIGEIVQDVTSPELQPVLLECTGQTDTRTLFKHIGGPINVYDYDFTDEVGCTHISFKNIMTFYQD